MSRVWVVAAGLLGLCLWAAAWRDESLVLLPTPDPIALTRPETDLRAAEAVPSQTAATSAPLPQQKRDLFSPERLSSGRVSEAWTLVSATSAVLYWQTENRARSYVRFGLTDRCEQRTLLSEISAVSGQPYWTHFHRLTGLHPETQYFYRLVCEATDGSTTSGEIRTFRTATPPHAVRVPDDLSGPPYVLDRPHTTYLLTRDLTFPLGGLLIKADGATLDMDGHTLVYNDQPAQRPPEWNKRAYEEHDFGIKVEGRVRVKIMNGRIRQGRGASAGTAVGIGCNPLFSLAAVNEIAGVEMAWSGCDVSGVVLYDSQSNHVHHCVLDDQGDGITDRHMAIRAIGGNVGGDYDHNLVQATRQQGLCDGVRVEHNEVYLRSRATNSFAITPSAKTGKPVHVAFNRIVGIGQHPVGIGMFGAYAPGSTVEHNRVEVQCTERGAEYGYAGSACFRTTWGADQLDVGHNTFIAHAARYGTESAKTRALWVGLPAFAPNAGAGKIVDSRGIFHDNRIVAQGPDGVMAGGICIVCLNESPNLIFSNNDVTSTWGNVLLADSYGHADGYAKFVGNVFRRAARYTDYHTVRQEYSGIPATGAFLNNRCQDGTDLRTVRLSAKGRIVLLELLDVVVLDRREKPVEGATVEIADDHGHQVFHGVTPGSDTPAALVSCAGPAMAIENPPHPADRGFIEPRVLEAGHLQAALPSVVVTDSGRNSPASYTVRVRKPGLREAVEHVQLDRPQALRIVLSSDGL